MVATATMTRTTTWNIDPAHSLVEFAVKHMMFTTVKGRFSDVSGSIVTEGEDLATAKIDVEVGTASIHTGDEKRDEHLRSADFFDVEKFPKLTFTSRKVEPQGGNNFRLVGDLTMHGVTKQVEMDVTYNGSGMSPFGVEVAGYTAQTELNRTDFGLTWNAALETGGVLVSEKVKVTLDIQAIKQA
jgi:polyisoprenoid-binding protein YceI